MVGTSLGPTNLLRPGQLSSAVPAAQPHPLPNFPLPAALQATNAPFVSCRQASQSSAHLAPLAGPAPYHAQPMVHYTEPPIHYPESIPGVPTLPRRPVPLGAPLPIGRSGVPIHAASPATLEGSMHAALASPTPSAWAAERSLHTSVPSAATSIGAAVPSRSPPKLHAPAPGERVVGERPISREELASTGNLVEGPAINAMSNARVTPAPKATYATPASGSGMPAFAYPLSSMAAATSLFDRLDRNHDGVTSRSEFYQTRQPYEAGFAGGPIAII